MHMSRGGNLMKSKSLYNTFYILVPLFTQQLTLEHVQNYILNAYIFDKLILYQSKSFAINVEYLIPGNSFYSLPLTARISFNISLS